MTRTSAGPSWLPVEDEEDLDEVDDELVDHDDDDDDEEEEEEEEEEDPEDVDDVPLHVEQDAAGSVVVDVSGRRGRDGRDGRNGRDGRAGALKKKGGRGRGTNGTNGTNATRGLRGGNASSLRLRLRETSGIVHVDINGASRNLEGNLEVNASGGRGGNGGDGGRGGSGGSGNPSGRDGQSGQGGDGGDGGNGGSVRIEATDSRLFGLVIAVDVDGGDAGAGGLGGGGHGRAGDEGEITFARVGGRRAQTDSIFGIDPVACRWGGEDVLPGPLATRGSRIVLSEITLQNTSAIEVDGPFHVVIRAPPPLAFAEKGRDQLVVVHRALAAYETRAVACAIELVVEQRSDIGVINVQVAPMAAIGDVAVHLGRERADKIFDVDINHRVPLSVINDEQNDDSTLLIKVLQGLNARSSTAQLAIYTGLLLSHCGNIKKLMSTPLRDRIRHFVDGRGIDQELFMSEIFAAFETDKAMIYAVSLLPATLHFFASLPFDTRGKVMDIAFHVAMADGVLSSSEKTFLRVTAAALGFDDAWLLQHMPKVIVEGDSHAAPLATNAPASVALAASVPLLACASSAIWAPSIPSWGWTHTCAIVVAVGAIAVPFLDAALYRRACAQCGSTDVAAVELRRERRRASLIGDGDGWRCRDCGHRAAEEASDTAPSLRHADRHVATRASTQAARIVAVLALLLLAGCVIVTRAAQLSSFVDVGLASAVVGVVAATLRHGQARLLTSWWLVLAAFGVGAMVWLSA